MATFVCELRNEIIGFAQLNLASHEDCVSGPNPVELQRIYVVPKSIGLGVGTQLIEYCMEEARKRGYKTFWLGVWENNQRALKFYQKFGFKEVGDHIFMVGNDRQRDLIVQRPLY